jgi:hypothetical protein
MRRGAKLLPKTTALLKYSLRRYANFRAFKWQLLMLLTHTGVWSHHGPFEERYDRAALLCFAF